MEKPLIIPPRPKNPLPYPYSNLPALDRRQARQFRPKMPLLHPYSNLPAVQRRQARESYATIQPWDQVGAVAPHLQTEDAGSRDQTKHMASTRITRMINLQGSPVKYANSILYVKSWKLTFCSTFCMLGT